MLMTPINLAVLLAMTQNEGRVACTGITYGVRRNDIEIDQKPPQGRNFATAVSTI